MDWRIFGRVVLSASLSLAVVCLDGCRGTASTPSPDWEAANPVQPLPTPPLGIQTGFEELAEPPTPERVRLGRWLFFDGRLSADGRVACATCHEPEHGYSQRTAVATGIRGQKGNRKAPSILNQAWNVYPNFFWDGRADSLEAQALGPIANPIEMGMTHDEMVAKVSAVKGYGPYFVQAFGSPDVTKERVVKAIADFERTQMSGGSAWDVWRENRDEAAVSDAVKAGHALFHGRAGCNQCHLNQNLTDSRFHNVGIGWNPDTQKFLDDGRFTISKEPADLGAFKTPSLRDVAKRPPYMHDGSVPTLRAVVEHYNRGGIKNPYLSSKIVPLGLTDGEIDSLVAFLEALTGTTPLATAPTAFPQ
ncbi:MAG: cytochrome c peroxidase [Vicinamibacterales bacterium]